MEMETQVQKPAWDKVGGGWLVSGEGEEWNLLGFLACWNRRHDFDRHREVGTGSYCGERVGLRWWCAWGCRDWGQSSARR